MTPLRFYVAEIQAYKPGAAVITYDLSVASVPVAALAQFPDPVMASAVILASDLGYRTAAADTGGVVPYPPFLSQAFAIDRKVNLDPGQSATAASWGTIELSNTTGAYSSIVASWNSDGRRVRVLAGLKTFDLTRQIWLDPAYTTLTPVFVGFATPWFLSDTTLSIPLRDASYWLEQPLQTSQYSGTGGLGGTADLAGRLIPKTRGGSAANPVRNVTPVLVDPVNRIYQYTDAPGTVVHLYEGGSLTYASGGDTTNLYAGMTAAGMYRTNNANGLFQLGNTPSGAITADVTGAFPAAGAKTTIASIARYLLAEDIALPAEFLNVASFTAADTAYPYTGGVYWDSSTPVDGVTAIDSLLAAMGAKLVPGRDGTLRLYMMRAIPAGAMAAASITTANAVSVTPVQLPNTLDPPPYRWRVGYQHNYTVQTSGVLPSAAAAQQTFVTTADRYAGFSSSTILTAYRRPNDTAPVVGGLLVQADAQALANDLGALWSVRRRTYDAVMPVLAGGGREIGDYVMLTWPMDDLVGGRMGQIVGEQVRAGDSTITYRILV